MAARSNARAGAARSAFTLIEALVATGILLVVFVIVGEVFSISTNAAGRVTAQAEMIESAAVFEQAVREQVRKIKQPGLLIIESPQPVGFNPADRRKDVEVGEAVLPLRHDRLVFTAAGAADEFESVTDRNLPSINNAGNTTGHAYASGEALVYFGPGFPDGRAFVTQNSLIADTNIPAKDCVLAQRVILLGTAAAPIQPPFASYEGVNPIAEYPSNDLLTEAPTLYYAAIDAVQESADTLIRRVTAAGWFDSLPQCNLCPTRITTDLSLDPNPAPFVPDGPFYRGRAAFNLLPRVADLRIEWTDGSPIDPTNQPGLLLPAYQASDPSTQWFGQPRDVNGARSWTPPFIGNSSGDVCPKYQWLGVFNGILTNLSTPPAPPPESSVTAFGLAAGTGQIEGAPGGIDYRAIWTPLTWQFRPKALRFTFRLYDEQDRFNISEVINQTPWANETPRTVKRWGQEFSFVVEVP